MRIESLPQVDYITVTDVSVDDKTSETSHDETRNIERDFNNLVESTTFIAANISQPLEENRLDKILSDNFIDIGNSWRYHFFAIEVGARGYCAYNVHSCFRRFGLNTKETKVVLSELTSTAIQCSFVI